MALHRNSGSGGSGDGGSSGGGYYAGGGPTEPPPPPDEALIEIIVALGRPPTAVEQRALDNLKTQIAKQTTAINNLADDAQIKLQDGSIVNGAERKQIWARTDFVVNENGTTYANGTDRGEAAYNNGNAQVSFNIGNLAGYDAVTGGVAYVIAHELGHMTAAGRVSNSAFANGTSTNSANEQIANDIARAIVNLEGDPVMANPGNGYSTGSDQSFSTPAPATTAYQGGGYYDTAAGYVYQNASYDPGTDYAYYDPYSGQHYQEQYQFEQHQRFYDTPFL